MHPPQTHSDDRRDRIGAILVAGVVALALVAVMITRTSEAVFTATVDNSNNYFHGGTVTLGDNDTGQAMFQVDAMDPGESYTSCINVEYSGSIASPSPVRIYSGEPPTESSVLGDHIELTVERGTSDSTTFGDCGNFTVEATPLAGMTLSTFYTDHLDYTDGLGTWTPSDVAETRTRTYRVTAELLESVPDSQEGATVDGVTFVWEIQS